MALRKKPIDEEEAGLRMAGLCARAEQCVFDISQKLYRLGLGSDVRNSIIDFLIENGFIDESRYASAYARDKMRFSSWGPYKIRQALAAKRISSGLIRESLESIEEEEWNEAAFKAASVKARQLELNGENSREDRLKLYRFLLTRGFDGPLSRDTVKQIAQRQREKES